MPIDAFHVKPKPMDGTTLAEPGVAIDALLVGTAIAIIYAVAFPRAAAAIFMIPVVLGFLALVLGRVRTSADVPVGTLPLAVLAFAGWSLATVAWSAAPLASLSKPLFLLGGTLGILVLTALAREAPSLAQFSIGRGVLIGVVAGGAFLSIETLTDQAITRFLYNIAPALRAGQEKHLAVENGIVLAIAENNINRRAAVVTLLLVPAVLTALAEPGLWQRWVSLGALAAITTTLLVFSGHQSSQIAIVAAVIAFSMARASPRTAVVLVGAAWCVSCLLVVPIVIKLHSTELHKDTKDLFLSARHRIVIWNYTAEQVLKAPLLGVGADATATITETRDKARDLAGEVVEKDGQFTPSAARHAHNGFLQTWYELGGVGAVILTAIGVFGLAATGAAERRYQPYLIAQFAAVAGMIAFSFGIWQLWFQGAIGLGILALLIAAIPRRSPSPDPVVNG